VLFIVVLFVVFTFYCFKMNWGDSSIEKLIKVYSDNSFLFDIADADYHNRVKRRCVLETLAAELGTTGIVTDRILIKLTFAFADDYQY